MSGNIFEELARLEQLAHRIEAMSLALKRPATPILDDDERRMAEEQDKRRQYPEGGA